jgi:hypothetical protein
MNRVVAAKAVQKEPGCCDADHADPACQGLAPEHHSPPAASVPEAASLKPLAPCPWLPTSINPGPRPATMTCQSLPFLSSLLVHLQPRPYLSALSGPVIRCNCPVCPFILTSNSNFFDPSLTLLRRSTIVLQFPPIFESQPTSPRPSSLSHPILSSENEDCQCHCSSCCCIIRLCCSLSYRAASSSSINSHGNHSEGQWYVVDTRDHPSIIN